MRVRDLMTSHVETTTPDATLEAAALKMRTASVGFLPVLDGERAVGVVTDRDITVRATAAGLDATQVHVRDVMTPKLSFCFEDQSIPEAERLMEEKAIGRLVVVDRQKRMVGVLSLDDLAIGATQAGGEQIALPPRGAWSSIAMEDFVIVSGSAHPDLSGALARELGLPPPRSSVERFPDGEVHVDVGEGVSGRDVILLQPTIHPVGEHLLELLLLADGCWRAGARTLSAVVPYFGYARQDHRSRMGEALAGHVVADLLGKSHLVRLIAVDLHSGALEGFFAVPLEHVSAVPLLANALRPHAGKDAIVVSPDLGGAKLAREYARLLELPMAVVHKTRTSPREVSVEGIIGNVRGLRPILVDDMITTGGTIEAAAKALLGEGCTPDIIVAATHGVLLPNALERLCAVGVRRLIVTDSVPPPEELPFLHEVIGLAALLAEAVRRGHVAPAR